MGIQSAENGISEEHTDGYSHSTILRIFVSLAILSACSGRPPVDVSPQWQPSYETVEGVVSPGLRDFIRSTTAPKVVLRVPNVVNSIIAADTAQNYQYDAFYGRLERQLIGAGFLVRDRALLQSLMSSGMTDYAQIGKRIDTDLIIEISSLQMEAEAQTATTVVDGAGQSHPVYPLTSSVMRADIRIVQVSTGAVGGLLTLRLSAQEIGPSGSFYDFNFKCPGHKAWGHYPDACWASEGKNSYRYSGYVWSEKSPYVVPQRFYVGVSLERAADRMSQILIDRLRGDI